MSSPASSVSPNEDDSGDRRSSNQCRIGSVLGNGTTTRGHVNYKWKARYMKIAECELWIPCVGVPNCWCKERREDGFELKAKRR